MKNKVITSVVFRKYKDGDIIALFPYDTERQIGECSSYMHVGQHGTSNYSLVIGQTKPASPKEYADLKAELENYGPEEANYHLDVISKISWDRHRSVYEYEQKRGQLHINHLRNIGML